MENFSNLQYYPFIPHMPPQVPSEYIHYHPQFIMSSFEMNPYPIQYTIPHSHPVHSPQWEYLPPPAHPSLYTADSYNQCPPCSPYQMKPPRSPMCFENSPVTQDHDENDETVMESKAIKAFEYYFSISNISSDWYLRKLMDNNLWVSLADILPFRRMKLYGIRTLEQLQELAIKTSTVTKCTNVVLDKSNVFVRPKWADWSEIKIKPNFANRNMKPARRRKLVRTATQEALDSILSGKEMSRETRRPKITLFGREKNGIFSASFNAPGVPSLIAPFLRDYASKAGTLCVIETTDSMFTEDFFSMNTTPHL